MDLNNISHHMSKKLQIILPQLASSRPSPRDRASSIDLSIAENVLLGEQVLTMAKEAIEKSLTLNDLSYPAGFGGHPSLLTALAGFFNAYFNPLNLVKPEHIITASGAGNAFDALLCSICDEGDQVLVAGPCWEGFVPYSLIHANVQAIVVNTPTLEGSIQIDVVNALKNAYFTASCREHIKAIVLTNPNNSLGVCYPRHVLCDILRFCDVNGLHLISDEVYAMSSLQSTSHSPPFISVLSLLDINLTPDLLNLLSRVHVIWSMSKDFGCSGIRMGCIVSQANLALQIGSGLASYWQTSSLTSIVATYILTSPGLPDLIHMNSKALARACTTLAEGLARLGIRYILPNYGLFLFAKVGMYCKTPEDEAAVVKALAENGLIVAPGQRFACGEQEYGWVRMTFSQPEEKIQRALMIIQEFCCHSY